MQNWDSLIVDSSLLAIAASTYNDVGNLWTRHEFMHTNNVKPYTSAFPNPAIKVSK